MRRLGFAVVMLLGTLALAETPCLPPGFDASLLSAPIVTTRPIQLPAVGTGVYLLVRYKDKRVGVIWWGSTIIAVDPIPDDPETPVWVLDDPAICNWRPATPGVRRKGGL